MGSANLNGKIKDLRELAGLLRRDRSRRRIVHCHGVFDLLHIGHIRHFEEARRLGDLLVVTLTRDAHVNKGPGRPVFPQELRAEAVAALRCVDYVALNEWPNAVPTIRLLRPHFYVKGPDYAEARRDVTGGIDLERRAVEALGGRFVVTDGITYSSSHLLNQYFPSLPKETIEYLRDFSRRHPAERVLGVLKGAASLKVLLVGESIVDEYRYCQAIGKSSKEPMLATLHVSTERFAGGILAVANHVADFCGKTSVVSYLGDIDSQERFLRSRLKPNVRPQFFYKSGSPTIVKRRFIDEYFFTKLLAVYEMNDAPLVPSDNRRFCDLLRRGLKECDLAVVVDFGHGLLGPEAVELLCRKAPFLAVNTQSNAGNQGYHTISRYPRADYVCMADNEFRLEARSRHGDMREIVREVSRKLHCPSVVVTGGKNGCLAFNRREGFFRVPAVAGKVVDRMGAGDAFFAVTAPCVFQGAPMEVTGFIGNVVGAEAVATVGHRASIDRVALLKHIETLLK